MLSNIQEKYSRPLSIIVVLDDTCSNTYLKKKVRVNIFFLINDVPLRNNLEDRIKLQIIK